MFLQLRELKLVNYVLFSILLNSNLRRIRRFMTCTMAIPKSATPFYAGHRGELNDWADFLIAQSQYFKYFVVKFTPRPKASNLFQIWSIFFYIQVMAFLDIFHCVIWTFDVDKPHLLSSWVLNLEVDPLVTYKFFRVFFVVFLIVIGICLKNLAMVLEM